MLGFHPSRCLFFFPRKKDHVMNTQYSSHKSLGLNKSPHAPHDLRECRRMCLNSSQTWWSHELCRNNKFYPLMSLLQVAQKETLVSCWFPPTPPSITTWPSPQWRCAPQQRCRVWSFSHSWGGSMLVARISGSHLTLIVALMRGFDTCDERHFSLLMWICC
jgi:hypothetical protein